MTTVQLTVNGEAHRPDINARRPHSAIQRIGNECHRF
jgi:hypothetical protein